MIRFSKTSGRNYPPRSRIIQINLLHQSQKIVQNLHQIT